MMLTMPMISVRVSDEEYEAVRRKAEEKGTNLADVMRDAMSEFLDGQPKAKGLKKLFSKPEPNLCEHPPSLVMQDAFGLYCDKCKARW